MIIQLNIEITQERFKECILAAMCKRFGEDDFITVNQIRDFAIGSKVISQDVDNLLLGSCLSELVNDTNSYMKRID